MMGAIQVQDHLRYDDQRSSTLAVGMKAKASLDILSPHKDISSI